MEAPAFAPQVGFSSSTIQVQTGGARHFTDITAHVQHRVLRSEISNGLAVVSSQHTTAAIVVNEHEPELLKDLDGFLTRIAPDHHVYAHNEAHDLAGEIPNGHSHCQALLLNTSVSLPIAGGKLGIGRYQRIFLLELDHSRSRMVSVTLLGT